MLPSFSLPILSVLVSRASLDSAKRCTSHFPVKRRESHFQSRQSHAVSAMTGDTNHQDTTPPWGLRSPSLATERVRGEGILYPIPPPPRHLGTNWRSCGKLPGISPYKGLLWLLWLGEDREPGIWGSSATTRLTTSPSRQQRASAATGRARKTETRAQLAMSTPAIELADPRCEHRRATRGLTPTCSARETGREHGGTSTAGDGKTVWVLFYLERTS